MKSLIFIFLLYIITTFLNPLHAQQATAASDDAAIKALMKEHKVPALGVGIIKDGKIVQAKVYGELAANKHAPANTIFNVASLTKPVVTMLTLKLVSMGKWNLDEPLANYWIDPDVKEDSAAYMLTARHVLSHQTGFVNWRWLHPTKKLTFDFKPGTKFQYSGEGFEYLRKALEKKFQKPLHELVDALVFGPLQMHDSRLTWDKNVPEARFAKWHDGDGKNAYETWKPQTPNAADDMLTTIEDYSKFGVAVLHGFDLPDSLYKDMITPRSALAKNSSMCLGWEHFDNIAGNEYALLHTGSDIGVKTLVLLFPNAKEGLVVFTNSDNGHLLYEKLIIMILGDLEKAFMDKAR